MPFNFNLSVDAKTSAGVYTKDGVLIRTLWSGVSYKAGSYAMNWDGKDDDGHLATDGSYDIKVLSNNVTASWEGVVGNTSKQFTGVTVHRGWDSFRCMTIAGSTAYYGKAYSEGSPSHIKFNLSDIQSRTMVLPTAGSGQTVWQVAGDGANIYWAGVNAYTSVWFVFATKRSDDTEVSFTKGTSLSTLGYSYKSVLDISSGTDSDISGLAVQKRVASCLWLTDYAINCWFLIKLLVH
ncbi:FlgD immunoglobulin-like domain containing protein [Spirosoma sp. KNUC1025]|uniref:FlgD immunoglobulin-like domain containing protein n=1 Tax=Spirosoma sp. KNUC1025 TaxID=2894082 RepID=UPI003863B430|nr:hypothetical protein LN737_22290 [Spirosoma sp. KNUC1025]